VSEDPSPCGLGDRLSNAQRGGFFSWFCLAAVAADEPSPDPAVVSAHQWERFRPSGPRFHHLVELAVGLDESGCIGAANLAIDRSFIEQPAVRPFARDIAKSFLHWVLPTEAAAALHDEIALIGAFADGESVVIGHSDALWSHLRQRFMRTHSEVEVFMGRRAKSARRVGHVGIAFENRADPRDEARSPASGKRSGWLFIRVGRE
jgi:hypothetical protein